VTLWRPSAERVAQAKLIRFMAGRDGVTSFADLHTWSVAHPEEFWGELWSFAGIVASEPATAVMERDPATPTEAARDTVSAPATPTMRDTRWFPGARLNYAENLLRSTDLATGAPLDPDRTAITSHNENGPVRQLTRGELRDEVARFAAGLRRLEVGPGDRVAGIVPNVAEAVIAMLATSSVGATWSSCSPDFGVEGALDRFGQIAPKVLVCTPAALWGGVWRSSVERIGEICAQLPSLQAVVVGEYGGDGMADPIDLIRAAAPEGSGVTAWADFTRVADPVPPLTFQQLPFDHPLFILFSSGTTGLPKGLVHGQGGTLIQHLKELVLHTDLGADDRIFYYTTCGWMMWNWVVSSLATGATLVLYDGSPVQASDTRMWDLIDQERITVFGTSAKYLALAEKKGMQPGTTHDLSSLRTILSTGSPLLPASFDWVYSAVKEDLHLASISGGTDIVSCFMLGNPIGPVHRGQLQCAGLGMKVEVWDDEGRPLPAGEMGELVCTVPFPAMPVGFWDDPEGSRYQGAYFEHFPPTGSVWRHGDWIERTEEGGFVVHGRSDTTLNPGGVRIGTAEIYRQVDQLPEILESVVIGQQWEDDMRIVLFVVLAESTQLDEELVARIRTRIRSQATPRHVPAIILQVPDIPRTLSGKISETAVRRAVHDQPIPNRATLANPDALSHFTARSELAPSRD